MNKIELKSTVKEIYTETFANPKRFLSLAALWLGLIAIVAFFGHPIVVELAVLDFYNKLGYPSPEYDTVMNQAYGYTFIVNLLSALLIGSFAYSSIKKKDGVAGDWKLLLFLFKYLLLSVFAFFALILLFSIIFNVLNMYTSDMTSLVIAAISAFVITAYPVLRACIILPDTFNETPLGFKKCWQATKGNILRLWAVVFMSFLPTILSSCLLYIKYSNIEAAIDIDFQIMIYDNRVAYVLFIVLLNVFTPLQGTMLAKIYDKLTKG